MKTVGNLLWIIFFGLWSAISWLVLGLIWCVTIIGIPFGLQAFKVAKLNLWPFGTNIRSDFGKHPIANVIWMLFGGIGIAFGYLVAGLILCITVIGIPFGKQCFKLMTLAVAPFGADLN